MDYLIGVYQADSNSMNIELVTSALLHSDESGMVQYEHIVDASSYIVLILDPTATALENAGYLRYLVVE
jgi:hypothetical protein